MAVEWSEYKSEIESLRNQIENFENLKKSSCNMDPSHGLSSWNMDHRPSLVSIKTRFGYRVRKFLLIF